jgi:HEPN domain-containing protein
LLDPREEVLYRYRLAVNYLREAENAFMREEWRLVVASAQLSVENSAKAIISYFKVPSWSHDPSGELLELINLLPEDTRELVKAIAYVVHLLAPEHGRSTYGEPIRGLTPWEIYRREEAEKALDMARRVLEYTKTILRRLGVEIQ